VRVVEAAREEIAFAGAMKGEELRPAIAGEPRRRHRFRAVILSGVPRGLALVRTDGRAGRSRRISLPIWRGRTEEGFFDCATGRPFGTANDSPVAPLRMTNSNFAVDEQVHLAGEARERGHHGAAVVIFDDKLRNENRVGEIRERVVEALRRVHAAERVEVGFSVFADVQGNR